jgi:hypothetical protein
MCLEFRIEMEGVQEKERSWEWREKAMYQDIELGFYFGSKRRRGECSLLIGFSYHPTPQCPGSKVRPPYPRLLVTCWPLDNEEARHPRIPRYKVI